MSLPAVQPCETSPGPSHARRASKNRRSRVGTAAPRESAPLHPGAASSRPPPTPPCQSAEALAHPSRSRYRRRADETDRARAWRAGWNWRRVVRHRRARRGRRVASVYPCVPGAATSAMGLDDPVSLVRSSWFPQRSWHLKRSSRPQKWDGPAAFPVALPQRAVRQRWFDEELVSRQAHTSLPSAFLQPSDNYVSDDQRRPAPGAVGERTSPHPVDLATRRGPRFTARPRLVVTQRANCLW